MMDERPDVDGLIEDPNHPAFRHEVEDRHGVLWIALVSGTEPSVLWHTNGQTSAQLDGEVSSALGRS